MFNATSVIGKIYMYTNEREGERERERERGECLTDILFQTSNP